MIRIKRHSFTKGWVWIQEAWLILKKDLLLWAMVCMGAFLTVFFCNVIPILGALLGALCKFVLDGSIMLMVKEASEEDKKPDLSRLFCAYSLRGKPLIYAGLAEWVLNKAATAPVAVFFVTKLSSVFSKILLIAKGDKSVAQELIFDLTSNFSEYFTFGMSAMLFSMFLFVSVWTSFAFAAYLITVKKQDGIWEVMKASFSAFSINAMSLTVMCLLWVVLVFLSFITLGLGAVVAIPLIQISMYTSAKDIFRVSDR